MNVLLKHSRKTQIGFLRAGIIYTGLDQSDHRVRAVIKPMTEGENPNARILSDDEVAEVRSEVKSLELPAETPQDPEAVIEMIGKQAEDRIAALEAEAETRIAELKDAAEKATEKAAEKAVADLKAVTTEFNVLKKAAKKTEGDLADATTALEAAKARIAELESADEGGDA